MSILPAALEAFCQRFPEATVRVVPAQPLSMLPELRAGTIDFAIGPRPAIPLGDDYDVEYLLNVQCTVVCRKGHPLQRSRSFTRLLSERWLVSSATGMMATDHDRFFLSQSLPVPTRVVQCDNSIAMMSLLASTNMLAILPRQWIEADLARGVYAEISLEGSLPEVEIVLVCRRGLPLTPTADAMLTLLRRQLSYSRKVKG
jgi:DNA-binding transcriptional LysR family regulator